MLTPTWNRAAYIERVWNGLISQTSKTFEWIVADDGSSDETEKVVRDLAAKSDFPVVLIQASTHIGKIRMDNEAVAHARGDFILWCDSDDYLLPNAIERLLHAWQSIPSESCDDYVGITALCATSDGVIVNPFANLKHMDVSWNDLAAVHGVTADMLFLSRASAMKAHPFPEVDLVIPESVVWTALGDKKARLIPEVLKVIEYGAAHCISFSGQMAYNRGRAYALATTVKHLRRYPLSWKSRWWRLITFLRYSKHGELGIRETMRLWGDNSSRLAFWLSLPLAWVIAATDEFQGKVNKTHREFLQANRSVQIVVERLGNASPADVAP